MASLLDLNTILTRAGLDPTSVMVMRHRPFETEMRRKLPWIISERPDLFLMYQQIQWKSAEKALTKATHLAAFIGAQPGQAVFAGLFRVDGHRPLRPGEYAAIPENQELIRLGMLGRFSDIPGALIFNLTPVDIIGEWRGKLIADWPPPERAWWRWAARNILPIHAILEESLFEQQMSSWEKLSLNWSDLSVLPRSWKAKLAEWRGVYFIYDIARKAGYVGSAYGADNILGRWTCYAETGHGGNKQLRLSNPEDLRFSILQRTSPDLAPEDVIAIESAWKDRLHTRKFGLNEN